MISSEMPELLGICDRIYVMNDGRFVGEFAAPRRARKRSCAPSCAGRRERLVA
jgi:putative multiple sugar transport system ATP-binding protein